MKRIILTIALLGFGFAVQAGGDCCKKATQTVADKPACCAAKEKVAVSTKISGDKPQCAMAAKAEGCPMAKAACKETLAKQQVLQSPKGFEQAKR